MAWFRRLWSRTPVARYAVLDLETTGLDIESNRVVECAIVTLDREGRPIAEWSTLIQPPGTDALGASWIHQIDRSMVECAPSFAEVADEIVARLRGLVVVGHVLEFDLGHLEAEFARADLVLPELGRVGLCTRELVRAHLAPGPRSLAASCARLDVRAVGLHTALGDARACAALLRWFLARGLVADIHAAALARRLSWPEVPTPAHAPLQRVAQVA